MKKHKTVIGIIIVSILFIAGFSLIQFIKNNMYSYSYIPMDRGIDEMAEMSDSVFIGSATGIYKSIKVDGRVTFRLTEVAVSKVIRGKQTSGDKIYITQTEGLDVDIELKTNTLYVLFIQPYVPGIEAAEGTYVLTQACKGVYRIDGNKTVYGYDISGKEQQNSDWVADVNRLYAAEITSAVAKE